MDTLRPPMPAHRAATQNTPLKLRTTSVPTTGKFFKAEDVNQELLVELEDATVDKGSLDIASHYILDQSNIMLPVMTQKLPSAGANCYAGTRSQRK